MPPKKKFAKKVKGKQLRDQSQPPEVSMASFHGPGTPGLGPILRASSNNSGNFSLFETSSSNNKLNEPCDSLYMRYKRATRNFKQAMERLVPVFEDTVVGLMNAVEYVADHSTSVDGHMMDDLKLAIRVRKRVANSGYYGGGDDGHSHFIAVLDYCWARLCQLERTTTRPFIAADAAASKIEDNDNVENWFAVLAMEEEDDSDGDDDEDDLPCSKIVRPPLDETSHTMTFEEMSNSEVRVDAIIFLMTLDELMGYNATQFQKLKEAHLQGQRSGHPKTAIVQQLMETATAVNFSIHQVAAVEQELVAQHEHLNTVYRLFAVVVVPAVIHAVAKVTRHRSPRAKDFCDADATAFVGDALECAFRNPDDPDNQAKRLDAAFCSKWQIPQGDMHGLGIDTFGIAFMAHVQVDWKGRSRLPKTVADGDMYQVWLPKAAFIGGTRRPITHTIRMLQGLAGLNQDLGCLSLKPGIFGPPWDEARNKAKKIAIDLDSVLLGDVLSHLFAMCKNSMLSSSLPHEDELLPLFVEIKKLVTNPRKPLSWKLAFAVHAVLTSIIEVQGDNCVRGLGEIAKASFETFLNQLQTCHDPTAKHWERNLEVMQKFRWLVATPMEGTPASEYIALWNPLCAGTFLSYLAYVVNVFCGSGMMDMYAQLRMVLHLFSGLIKHDLISPGELPILDFLYSKLADRKALWGGPLPERGELVKRWWISYGMNINWSIRKTEETKMKWDQRGIANRLSNTKSSGSHRQMTQMRAEELSQSFRRICLRDFTGVVDKRHNAQQKREGQGTILYEHVVRVNDTLDWMKADQAMLSTNLTCVGAMLDQFVKRLSVQLEWQPSVEQIARETPRSGHRFRSVPVNSQGPVDENMERLALVHFAAHNLFGALDFHANPLEVESLDVAKTVVFTKLFFSQIDMSSLLWYTPPPEEE